jgi:hypothetical protein
MNDMTLTLAITINVLLDVAILGLLAFVMSRASKLTPHVAVVPDAATAAVVHAAPPRARRHAETVRPRRRLVLD